MRHTQNARRRLLTAVTVVACLTGIAGCGGEDEPAGQPTGGQRLAANLTALITQRLQSPEISAFERDVLQRSAKAGAIADGDYEEAHSRYATCVKAAGYTEDYKKLPNGVYQISLRLPPDADDSYSDKWFKASGDCAKGTLAVIEAIYTLQKGNQQLRSDPNEVAALCLVQAGAAAPDYTADKFSKDLESNFADAPYSLKDPKVTTCLSNAGISVAIGDTP